jgi:hypothetical protein
MTSNLPIDVMEDLKIPFEKLLSTENFGDVVNTIAELISQGMLTSVSLDTILNEYNIKLDKIKSNILDMILSYINITLEDNYIMEKEASNVNFLKRFFKIKEGDFYSLKYYDIERILEKQFEHMYKDNSINNVEALQKFELQELFNLSYDQFLQLSEKAVRSAIARGANLMDLDTFIKSSLDKRPRTTSCQRAQVSPPATIRY